MKRRNSRRLPDYDYSEDGAYFVTMVLHPRWPSLGHIVRAGIELSIEGKIVEETWQSLGRFDDRIRLDEFCVMPDHVHGIIFIVSRPSSDERPAIHELQDADERRKTRRRMLLPRIIGRFKQSSAKKINLVRRTPGRSVWKRDYYEHVIRSNDSLERIRQYIRHNPVSKLMSEN